jgi:ABC-type uncharacterized transport system substrate-binding protein
MPFVLFLAFLMGCTHEPPKVDPVPAKIEEPVAAPEPVIVPPPEVAILVSSNIPAYREVADAISARLGSRAHAWQLNPSSEHNVKVIDDIAKSQRSQVVAIGLDAAVIAKKLADKQVIFCQVFNYDDQQLPSATRKGVSMLPSFEKSFAAWKAISPGLKQIAIITGPGLDEYVSKAKVAARMKGISLIHREVNSDMELLVEYKNIASKVQGYWLWPDNRVLSNVVMRDVLTFSMRSGKQVAVFNNELLELGGLISITSNHKDIANNVIKRLDRAEGKAIIPGAVIEPLDVANIRINALMAKRFGLNVPSKYRKYLDAP